MSGLPMMMQEMDCRDMKQMASIDGRSVDSRAVLRSGKNSVFGRFLVTECQIR